MAAAPIEPMPAGSPQVELIEPPAGERLSLEIDLAASLLYPHTHYRYAQIRAVVASLSEAGILEIVALGTAHRGRHDELPRAYAAANGLRFDILMDIGGFRDMHRHRRCTQLLQAYTPRHGYDVPDFPGQPAVSASAAFPLYDEAMQRCFAAHAQLSGNPPVPGEEAKLQAYSTAAVPVPEFRKDGAIQMEWKAALPTSQGVSERQPAADYVLPLATRCRSLFTMDFAQAVYMSELRSTPAGHWSYRNVAWQMYQAVARRHPGLAQHFRIDDPHAPVDLLQR